MKIVFSIIDFHKTGGLRVIIQLCNTFTDLGHNVFIITPSEDISPFKISKSVKIIRLKCSKYKIIKYVEFSLKLALIMPKNSDYIISTYFLTYYINSIANFFLHVKHIYFIQGDESLFSGTGYLMTILKRRLAIFSYKSTIKKIVISAWLLNQINRFNKENMVIVNNGINTDIFKKININRLSNKFIIGFIAAPGFNKGLDFFIDVCNKLMQKNSNFFVKFITSYDCDIVNANFPYQIIRPADDSALVYEYNQLDLFVSTALNEGFSLPSLEAMACQVPVITTDSGGVRDFAIDGFNAIIVKRSDATAIANAIDKISSDKYFRDRLILNGINTALNMSWETAANKFLDSIK